jgi:hypothetical protein
LAEEDRVSQLQVQLNTSLFVEMHQEILKADFKGKHLCMSLRDHPGLRQEASVLKVMSHLNDSQASPLYQAGCADSREGCRVIYDEEPRSLLSQHHLTFLGGLRLALLRDKGAALATDVAWNFQ